MEIPLAAHSTRKPAGVNILLKALIKYHYTDANQFLV